MTMIWLEWRDTATPHLRLVANVGTVSFHAVQLLLSDCCQLISQLGCVAGYFLLDFACAHTERECRQQSNGREVQMVPVTLIANVYMHDVCLTP